MLPASDVMNPAIMFSVVVLPQPLGPRSVTNSPCATRRLIASTAVAAPKRLVSPASCKAGSAMTGFLIQEVADPHIAAERGDQRQRDQHRHDGYRCQCRRKAE